MVGTLSTGRLRLTPTKQPVERDTMTTHTTQRQSLRKRVHAALDAPVEAAGNLAVLAGVALAVALLALLVAVAALHRDAA